MKTSASQDAAMDPARLDNLNLWPYEEARKLLARRAHLDELASLHASLSGVGSPLVFEAGFGPSGLPHLGTMAEILRPSFVRRALELLAAQRRSRLIVFIDDLDGLRKVPENVPDRQRVEQSLGQPVSQIPDPFGCCESFAGHMVGLLEELLKPLELEYEMMLSSRTYASGRFDLVLLLILSKYREIIDLMTPTLREEHRAAWSPFLPLCPSCGQINSTRVTAHHPDRGTVEFSCDRTFGAARPCGFHAEQSVLGGKAKVQWKVDWALRWRVLEVDYELYGKDLIDSARLSGQIVRLLDGRPPLGFPFEMFLDEQGHKVSKSIGRGVAVEQWQRYAPIEALKYFLFVNPRRARKLFLAAIPQYVDEYLDELRAYAAAQNDAKRLESPLTFVLGASSARRFNSDLSFSLMMNLAAALGVSDRALMWNYLARYDPGIVADDDTRKMTEVLLDCALNFRRDYLEPALSPYAPAPQDRVIAQRLIAFLTRAPEADARAIETAIYDIGRELFAEKPGQVFQPLYCMIMLQERGPRLGAFIRLATPERVVAILEQRLGR